MTAACPMGVPDCHGVESQKGIHFDYKISLQNLLTALLMIGGFIIFFSKQESRLVLLEKGLSDVSEKNRDQDREFRAAVYQINEKLDRLIERQLERGKR